MRWWHGFGFRREFSNFNQNSPISPWPGMSTTRSYILAFLELPAQPKVAHVPLLDIETRAEPAPTLLSHFLSSFPSASVAVNASGKPREAGSGASAQPPPPPLPPASHIFKAQALLLLPSKVVGRGRDRARTRNDPVDGSNTVDHGYMRSWLHLGTN